MPDGHVVATVSETLAFGPHTSGSTLLQAAVPHPHFWSPAAPVSLHVYTETRADGKTTDFVTERTGFRTARMTPTGFFLNDVLTPLRGVAKHQETEERASAVTPADLTRDWDDLQELGVNYVRLAHYPHAELEYDLADERGIVVWAENGHSNPAAPTATGDQITREMVRQNYNHPSICFWSVGNEAIQRLVRHGHAGTVCRHSPGGRPVPADHLCQQHSLRRTRRRWILSPSTAIPAGTAA